MFSEHQPRIARYALQSPDNLFRVLQFVILTIRQPIAVVPSLMVKVDRLGGNAPCLWGHKSKAWRDLSEARAAIYADALELDAIADPEAREFEALCYFSRCYGLGLVKAGFVIQLALGCGGCLDTHNADRFNLSRQTLRSDDISSERNRQKRAKRYLDICHGLGGTESLWNGWCQYVAQREPVRYRSADHVSELHCEALGV